MKNHEIARVSANLEVLAACEEAVAEFYEACAQAWPEERNFWNDLAVDEMVQAARLHLMRLRAGDSVDVAESVRLFPPPAVQRFIGWVRAGRDRVRTGRLDLRGALAMARDLEQSPIMGEHFRVTRETASRVADYLLAYATEFGDHERRISTRLELELRPARIA